MIDWKTSDIYGFYISSRVIISTCNILYKTMTN